MSITPQELRNCATMLEKYGYAGAAECTQAAFEIERLRGVITKADYLLTEGAPTLALRALQDLE